MGCDIHVIAEVKSQGTWKPNTKAVFPNPYYEAGSEVGLRKDQYLIIPDDNRSYDWFAILADVRNGRGFAGIKTGAGFDIISEPRGIPEDASQEWLKKCEEWSGDMHSHSYLTLEDFDKFDWNQVTVKTGVIPLDEYIKLRGTNNSPDGWSGSISGGNIVTISEEEADQHIRTPIKSLKNKNIYVQYHWSVIYADWFKFKIQNVIEPMRGLLSEYPEGVRIVFGFDN